ncbi:MAG: hypothetical protein LQ351_004223 [Letrouitia transgressa]|nr:MAG: hypothetical protein LQ351_004223 [Letrouitia transgressa]
MPSRSYQLELDTSPLTSDHSYKFRFKPLDKITHWPAQGEEVLSALSQRSDDPPSADKPSSLPEPADNKIPWDLVNSDNDTITFRVRSSPLETPQVYVLLTAPSTFSLSNNPPFKFTLTFSTASGDPFTALAERESVRMANTDIKILDATSRELIGPEPIDDGNRDGFWVRRDFLEVNGVYTEDRIVDDLRRNRLEDLQVGREYILHHLPGEWSWWTEDTLDEVMTYVDRGDLGRCERIKFASAGEARFHVVA